MKAAVADNDLQPDGKQKRKTDWITLDIIKLAKSHINCVETTLLLLQDMS
jgi:hypothetical protein